MFLLITHETQPYLRLLLDAMAQLAVGGQLGQARQPLGEALPRDVIEVVVERVARRHFELRHVQGA